MPSISKFTNQTATYERYIGDDDWSNKLYAAPTNIKVRYTTKYKLMQSATETRLVRMTEVLADASTPIYQHDRINGDAMLAIETIVSKGGQTLGYKAFPHAPSGY